MKLTVLGKYGPYAPAGGGTSSYLVQEGENALVLDFGSGAFSRLQSFLPAEKIHTVVLSHLHNDHVCDLLPFSYYLQASGRQAVVIAPDTDCPQRDFLRTLTGLRFVSPENGMRVGNMTLSFARMEHPLESFAVKVQANGRTLCYSGDTVFCPELPAFCKGSDLLLLDCAKPENASAPHLSLSEAAFLSESLHVPVVASHLNPALRYESRSPFVKIAEEGKSYEV